MAINTIAAYIYDEDLLLNKQGTLEWEGELGTSFTFNDLEADIQQGDIGVTRLVFAVPLATFSGGTPLVVFRRSDGYTSSMLTMNVATYTIDSVQYQAFYIDLTTVGWTYKAGRHAVQVGYLVGSDYDSLPMVFYTVQDGVNDYAEVTADSYQEISNSLHDQYANMLDQVAKLEGYIENAFNYSGVIATGIDYVNFYNAIKSALVSFDGTNLVLNRNDVNEEIMTVLNEIGDLANVVLTTPADNDILIKSGSNWVNISKADFLEAVTDRLTVNEASIVTLGSSKENLANKATDFTTVNDTKYPTVEAVKEQLDLKENLANKKIDLVDNSDTYYPSQKAVKTAVDLKVNKAQTLLGILLDHNITRTELLDAIQLATQSDRGLMSAEDKVSLDTLVALLATDDADSVVNTVAEILTIFESYPEGADLVTALAGKVDKVTGKGLSTNDLTDTLKDHYDLAYTHSQVEDGTNPHNTTFANIASLPTTLAGFGITDGYTKTEIDALLAALQAVYGWESSALAEDVASAATVTNSVWSGYTSVLLVATDGTNTYTEYAMVADLVNGITFTVGSGSFVVGATTSTFTYEGFTLDVIGFKMDGSVHDEMRSIGEEIITYRDDGKISSVVADTVTTTPTYDEYGNITKITEVYALDGKTYETTFTRDAQGRIINSNKQEVL